MLFTARTSYITELADETVFGFGVNQFAVPAEDSAPYVEALEHFRVGRTEDEQESYIAGDEQRRAAVQHLLEARMIIHADDSYRSLAEDAGFKNRLYLDLITSDAGRALDELSGCTVIIAGSGGIGNFMSFAFSSFPVAELVLMDYDTVEESNLNRQFLFTRDDLGQLKVEALASHLGQRAPQLKVTAIDNAVTAETLAQVLDSRPGRKLVVVSADSSNVMADTTAACIERGVPFINVGYLNDISVVGPFWIPESRSACPFCGETLGLAPGDQPSTAAAVNKNFTAPSAFVNNATASAMAMSDVLSYMAGDLDDVMSLGKRIGINTRTFERYEIALEPDPTCRCATSPHPILCAS